jgi:hypothetical protein
MVAGPLVGVASVLSADSRAVDGQLGNNYLMFAKTALADKCREQGLSLPISF